MSLLAFVATGSATIALWAGSHFVTYTVTRRGR